MYYHNNKKEIYEKLHRRNLAVYCCQSSPIPWTILTRALLPKSLLDLDYRGGGTLHNDCRKS
ncbi:MAG: hypothetical protein K0R71_2345 [Bacillales bacterium]|jgi:hypothetical protein|nr:hypothetical protein [Bacillales bacterium]